MGRAVPTEALLSQTAQPDDETMAKSPRPVPYLRLLYTKSQGIIRSSLGGRRGQPTVWRLDAGELRIGRGAPPDEVCLADDSQVSRLHATVTAPAHPEGRPTLRDEGSSNGCFVNGVRHKTAELSDGDLLRVGGSLLLLRIEPSGLPVADALVDTLIGQSLAIRRLRHEVALWAPAKCTVLLLGDSGTGKEVTARALHTLSGVKGPLVAVNCAAIPETLAESQLFGHVTGAFTGAKAHPGYFRAAAFGTLLLDEVGELPLQLQAKLLRALEEGVITPVGSVEPQPCPVRVLAATNRNLAAEVQAGKLRGDLYARLSEIVIRLPPLRERREDILLLLGHFLGESPPLHPLLAEALVLYPWPWNVRELSKVATELRVRGAKLPQLTVELIAERLTITPPPPTTSPLPPTTPLLPPGEPGPLPPKPPMVPTVELPPLLKAELVAALQAEGGRIAQVARALGRSRQQIYRALQQHQLSPDDYRNNPPPDPKDPPD